MHDILSTIDLDIAYKSNWLFCQVTADIHVYQATSLQVLFIVFTISNMIRAVFISVPFWATFAIIWLVLFSLG